MTDGDYLANDATAATKDQPTEGGYAYYENGVLTLHDYRHVGVGVPAEHFSGMLDDYASTALIYTVGNLTLLLEGDNYLENTNKADELIKSNLFRPPHGWMRWGQYMVLKHRYKIVMWDLVTRDYSNRLNGPQVLEIVKKYVRNGSIITFHDSIKSEKNMKYALPRAIEWLQEQGYEFKVFD
jgi:hypothetical protein